MAFADNQISSVSIGANVYVANNAFDGSGNFSFVGFYNSQGRKAGTYGISWRIVSAVAATQPARPASGSTASTSTPSAAAVASTTQATTAKQSGPKITSESTVVFAGNGHRYEVINKSITWTKARDDCKKRGGYLATITSNEEQEFIIDLLSKQGKRRNYWLGGYREGKDWKWVTGEDFTYTNWIPGEPNNAEGKEDKLLLSRNRGNKWNDSSNNNTNPYEETLGYICEWDAD